MKNFLVEIVTPDTAVFSGEVAALQAPGSDGLFQVLADHAPLISTLGKGNIKLDFEDGTESKSYQIEGGVVEVLKNKAIVLIETLISGDIDKDEEE